MFCCVFERVSIFIVLYFFREVVIVVSMNRFVFGRFFRVTEGSRDW